MQRPTPEIARALINVFTSIDDVHGPNIQRRSAGSCVGVTASIFRQSDPGRMGSNEITMAACSSSAVLRMAQSVDKTHDGPYPFIRLVPCITDPWARSVLLEIPWAKTSIQRERRAIICAFDCMSTLMLLMAGLDSNASPLAALNPPIIDDLIRQCDERRISRVYHALH